MIKLVRTDALKSISLLICVLIICLSASAQSPYILNGNATQDDCHCYTLTKELEFQSASIWNKNKIDLTQPFNYSFNIYAGCLDSTGADGIAFVLQPVSTSLGAEGAGMGFQNIYPSLGVTIDTYQNIEQDDPGYDHIGVQANGDTYHKSVNNLAGPVRVLPDSDNIEDCKWHKLEIKWEPVNSLLEVSIDGTLRLSLQKDIIASIFNNNPFVFWGFTAGTGYIGNLQRVCMPLNAGFMFSNNNTCVQTPLAFSDTSNSFGSISNWYWNFDDGATSTLQNPTHTYTSPGMYDVTLNITGEDGCVSDTFKQQVTIGTYPAAGFQASDAALCSNRDAVFTDATTLEAGTVNYYYWNFGNGTTSNLKDPLPIDYSTGDYNVQFYVKTKEGCASDTVVKKFTIMQAPNIDFTKNDACKNVPVNFIAKNFSDTISISRWHWNFQDNSFSNDSSVLHAFANGGQYNVSLVAGGQNGCVSDTITKAVNIYATNANAGNDTTILLGYPYQLKGSGGYNYTWSPATGLNNPFIANPVATLADDITYTLTTSTILGCSTSDIIHIKVVKGPEIYVPTAFTPNNDGRNDRFKIAPAGISEISFFKILNRMGQVIYSSKNSLSGWDGTLNGIPQPAGTYVWIIAGKTIDNSIIKKQGTIVLIR